MKAIFIGGPLHGQIQQVESNHNHVAWVPPRIEEDYSDIVRYNRRINFGDVAIFTVVGLDADQQLVEAVERGLQLQAEPPIDWTVRYLLRHVHFRNVDETEVSTFIDRVRVSWAAWQECSTNRRKRDAT